MTVPLEPRGPGGAAGEVRGGRHQGEALREGEEGQVVHQECRHIQGQYFIAKYLGHFFIFLLISVFCFKLAYDFADKTNRCHTFFLYVYDVKLLLSTCTEHENLSAYGSSKPTIKSWRFFCLGSLFIQRFLSL